MKMAKLFGIICCWVSVAFFLCGCDQSKKQIGGGYYLERFDEGGPLYYVEKAGKEEAGGGVFDGVIQEIGWNQDYILARVRRLYHGDTNGWYALSLKTDQITGPFLDKEIATNFVFSHIKTTSAASAF